jgi:hypothetical protein
MVDVVGATTNLVSTASGAVNSAVSAIESGPAAALSGVASGVSNILGSVSSLLGAIGGNPAGVTKVPMPNPLSAYASYDYVLTLSAMAFKDINFPDSSYKAGKTLPIICASASKNPNNRVQTKFGKFEFYLDNLKFETAVGITNPKTTSVTTVQFDVFEPYSLGMFPLALQTAALKQGWRNWREAPFLLTIEFRGNKETGQMSSIPNTTRHIPIKLTKMLFKANEQGSSYAFNAFATQAQALTVEHAGLKTDMTIKGKTVQEVLQTGEQSLQAVVNRKLKELVKNKEKKVADEVIILFPNDHSSAGTAAFAGTPVPNTTATVNPALSASASSVYQKLGVIESSVNKTYVQDDGAVNLLGSSSMGYDLSKTGDPTTKDETAVLKNGVWTRGNIISNPTEGSLRFAQNVDIPTVINTVMLMSDYPKVALDSNNQDKNGMKTWWKIDTQVYYIETNENMTSTGTVPKVVVYRVLPYKTHSSKQMSANQVAVGYPNIKKQVCKSYDYIFTGKNTEIIKFDIDFSISFSNLLAADGLRNSEGVVSAKSQGGQEENPDTVNQNPPGIEPSTEPGVGNTTSKHSSTESKTDRKGGGGTEDAVNRAAKLWHDAISNPLDMLNLNMEIVGDPYWIVNSGMGNYTSKEAPISKDLNTDGSVNYQTSEVDIYVNFKNPLDINQTTGLYDFKSYGYAGGLGTTSDGAIGFKGLYHINTVTNHFRQGEFRQTLKGSRRKLYESNATPTAMGGLSSNIPDIVSNIAGGISSAMNSIGSSISSAVTSAGSAIQGAVSNVTSTAGTSSTSDTLPPNP